MCKREGGREGGREGEREREREREREPFNLLRKLVVVVQACNPSPGEAEAGRWQVRGHLGLHSKVFSQK
jgi:hypothetical protein